MKKLLTFLFGITATLSAYGATVVATINGVPVTDTDITARTQLMARQGKTSTDNRRVALQNIIDDHVKLEYAANFGVKPTDKDANSELENMKMTGYQNLNWQSHVRQFVQISRGRLSLPERLFQWLMFLIKIFRKRHHLLHANMVYQLK